MVRPSLARFRPGLRVRTTSGDVAVDPALAAKLTSGIMAGPTFIFPATMRRSTRQIPSSAYMGSDWIFGTAQHWWIAGTGTGNWRPGSLADDAEHPHRLERRTRTTASPTRRSGDRQAGHDRPAAGEVHGRSRLVWSCTRTSSASTEACASRSYRYSPRCSRAPCAETRPFHPPTKRMKT